MRTLLPIGDAHDRMEGVYEIPAPMLAKSVPAVPTPDRVEGGMSYEPKWDGFLH